MKTALTDTEYYDEVGGFHASGVGYAPDSTYCGQCDTPICTHCRVWQWKQKKQSKLKNVVKPSISTRLKQWLGILA